MSETRRELFKTSVITALGVSAGAVAACSPGGIFGTGPRLGDAGSVVAVQEKGGSPWYLFRFTKYQADCELYSVVGVPPLSNVNNIDTGTWFAVAPNKKRLTTGTIKITYNSGSLAVTFTGGYVAPGVVTSLLALLPPTPPVVAGSWNEIGTNTA